jgi:hypothetical protein
MATVMKLAQVTVFRNAIAASRMRCPAHGYAAGARNRAAACRCVGFIGLGGDVHLPFLLGSVARGEVTAR